MRRGRIAAALLTAALTFPMAATAVPHDPFPAWSPNSTWSSDGDFATDTFGDPWDFSNPEDVMPIAGAGVGFAPSASLSNGTLKVDSINGTTVRFLFNWPNVIPWGRDGLRHPIDASIYTRVSFSMYSPVPLSTAIRFERADGIRATIPFNTQAGWHMYTMDLTNPTFPPGWLASESGPWGGKVIRFEWFRSGNGTVPIEFDWVRLHRADTPDLPPATPVPAPVILNPSEEGGADYASAVRGNPWDFAGPDDVALTNHIAGGYFANGDYGGATISNDPFVLLPLAGSIDADRFHRATIDVCYDGGFSLDDAPGGGMMGRLAWQTKSLPQWTETQDFIVFPGCNRMTFDMKTKPAAAVHDEGSVFRPGWAGMSVDVLRYDLNEDRGSRNFTLREIKVAEDATFTTTYPIQFADRAWAGGTTADLFVSTTPGAVGGTQIASGISVGSGVNTFTWNGTALGGARLPNGTYHVSLRLNRGGTRTTAGATGPLVYAPAQPTGPGYFVPVNPFRLLDTRDGTGGVISPLGTDEDLELQVTGVGSVPATGVRGVVMNVTVDGATQGSFLTVWPSDEGRPFTSNLNFGPGQTVPNLVAAKLGASGRVRIYNSSGLVNVVADVVGYYAETAPTSGGRFTALQPARLLDTRDGTGRGGSTSPIGQGQSINLSVLGRGGVPTSGVAGVALNVTVTEPTSSGFLTTWPTGEAFPLAATHNFTPGLTVANLVLAKVGAGGQVSIFNNAGNSHVIADVVGYFSAQGGQFVPLNPGRLLDTRDGNGTGGVIAPVGGGSHIDVQATARSGVPSSGVTGVVVNVTATNVTTGTHVTIWPTGQAMPGTASLNPRPGPPAVGNLAYAKVGTNGRISIYNNAGSVDLIADVMGYVT